MARCVTLTGATGFVGAALVPALRAAGYEVNTYTGRVERAASFWCGSPLLHLACETAGDYGTNIAGTAMMVHSVMELGRLVFASSVTAQAPVDRYDREKALGEAIVGARPDITAVILRLASVYGPGQQSKRCALNQLMRRALYGDTLELYGNAAGLRDFVHLADVVRAFILALDAPAGTYDVGTGVGTSLVDAAGEVARQAGVRCDVSPVVQSVHHPVALEANWLPSWQPTVALKDGITSTLDWLRANEPLAREVAA